MFFSGLLLCKIIFLTNYKTFFYIFEPLVLQNSEVLPTFASFAKQYPGTFGTSNRTRQSTNDVIQTFFSEMMFVLQSISISYQALFNNAEQKCLDSAGRDMFEQHHWWIIRKADWQLKGQIFLCFWVLLDYFVPLISLSFIIYHSFLIQIAKKQNNWTPLSEKKALKYNIGSLGIFETFPIWAKCCKLLKKYLKLRSVIPKEE